MAPRAEAPVAVDSYVLAKPNVLFPVENER